MTPLLLSAVLAQTPATPPLMDGFGRFGKIHEDGLLTLNVTPSSFRTGNVGPGLVFSWEKPQYVKVAEISGTGKSLDLTSDKPTVRRLDWTLLYPGFEMTIDPGAVLKISDESGKPSNHHQFIQGKSLTYVRRDGLSPAITLVVLTDDVTLNHSYAESTVSFRHSGPVRLRVVTPTGIRPQSGWGKTLSDEVARWEKTAIPRLTSLAPSAIGEVATYSGSTIAPIPPVWGFAKGLLPPKGMVRGPETKWGPFLFVPGNRVEIPLPPYLSDSRSVVGPESIPAADQQFIDSFVIDPEMNWAVNAVDLGFSRRTPVLLAGAAVSEKHRETMTRMLGRDLPRAFRIEAPTWRTAKEPFTGKSYVWTFGLEGPGGYQYDVEWGNLLPVYGLYQYALASGDWEMVRRLWPGVRQALEFVLIGQDWAWMTGVNAEHGHSTGTGDPLNAAYVGMIAAEEMADQLGYREEAARYRWIVRRMAIPTAARLVLTPWARERGLVAPERIVLGFHETEAFTRSPLPGGDPWYPHSLFSGNGMFPELLALYAEREPQGLRDTVNFLAKSYPEWMNGSHRYPFDCTYDGNSVYATFPQVYARQFVSGMQPTGAQSWRWMRSIATNRTHAWVGSNVVAEVMGREKGLWLTSWRPAALVGARWKGSRAELTLKATAAGEVPVTWRAEGPAFVQRVVVPPGVTSQRIRGGVILSLKAGQTVTITLECTPGTRS